MSISIEALAMVGADYLDWGMDIEEWERRDSELPPHLLAEQEKEDDDEEEEVRVQRKKETICGFPSACQVKDFENRVTKNRLPSRGRGV